MKRIAVILTFLSLLAWTADWLGSVAWAVSIPTLGVPVTEDFNTLASTGTSSTVPSGWFFNETGTNANTIYTAGTGSSNAGDTYSYGSVGNTERAFGMLLSGSLTPTIGAMFTNDTGASIVALDILYTGEQWRLGTSVLHSDRIDFQYSLNATSLATGTWSDADALDFTSPVQSGTVGALDGNSPANRTLLSQSITALSIPPGSMFWIRWLDFNATGADDGLAVDDFSLTGQASNTPVPEPTTMLLLGSGLVGLAGLRRKFKK